MTLYQNSFEGGTDGTNVTTGNSGGASGDAFSAVNATVKFATAAALHGSMGGRFTGGSGWVKWTASSSAFALRFYMKLPASAPSGGDAYIATMPTAAGYAGTLSVDSSKRISLSSDADIVFTSAALSSGTVYRIEVAIQKGTTTSNGTLRFGYYVGDSTTPVETVYSSTAQNTGTNNYPDYAVGDCYQSWGSVAYIDFDDLALQTGTTDFIGPVSSGTTPVSNTNAQSWAVQAQISKTTAESWAVRSAVTPATNAQSWAVKSAVTQTAAESWAVRAQPVATVAESWAVRQAITQTAVQAWAVNTSVDPATNVQAWAVRTAVSATSAQSWAVTTAVSPATSTQSWAVQAAVSQSVDESWAVQAQVVATIAEAWNVAATGQVATSNAQSWAVRVQVVATVAEAWNVSATLTVTSSVAQSWHVRVAVAKTAAEAWAVRTAVAPHTVAVGWAVRVPVSQSTAEAWAVLGRISHAQAQAWHVRALVAKVAAETWSVRQAMLQTVAQTWAAMARVSLAIAESWDVRVGAVFDAGGLGMGRHAGLTAEWFKVSCGPAPDYALTISISTDGQIWTELEGPHASGNATLARSRVTLAGVRASRGDDGDVRVDQVGIAP